MGLFFPRYKTFELKCYRAVKCDDNEEWCKIWKKNWLVFWKWHEWGIGEFDSVSWVKESKYWKSALWWVTIYNPGKNFQTVRGVLCVDTGGVVQSVGKKLTDKLKIICFYMNFMWEQVYKPLFEILQWLVILFAILTLLLY